MTTEINGAALSAVENSVTQTQIFFQVNKRINISEAKKRYEIVSKSIKGKTIKDALASLIKSFNYHEDGKSFWDTEKGTGKDLFKLCQQGFTVRGGIKEGGNSKENVEKVFVLFIDIDNEEFVLDTDGNKIKNSQNKYEKKLLDKPASWEDTTATKYGAFASFWYPSPSYTEKNQKHRLGFILDRGATRFEAETILKYLYDTFTESNPNIKPDPSCFDAGRLYYGAANPELGEYFGDDKLPVDTLLEEARQKNEKYYFDYASKKINIKTDTIQNATGIPNESKEVKKKQKKDAGITAKVLQYFYEEYFVKQCNYDVNRLYSLFDHNFKSRTPDEPGMIEKYDGSNPFSASNSSGTSFSLNYFENELPTFVDRSASFERTNKTKDGKIQHGGSWIDYVVFILRDNKAGFEYIKSCKDLTGAKFRKAVKDICDYFEIKPFDFQQSSEDDDIQIAIDFIEDKAGKLYKFHGNETLASVFCYVEQTEKWRLISSRSIFGSCIVKPWLIETYGVDSPKARSTKLIKFIWEYVIHHHLDFFDEMLEKPTNLNYLPMQNGVLNIATKKLTKNDGTLYNRNKSVYARYEVKEDNINVVKFNQWLKEWLKNEEKVELVICWFSLVCQRQAYLTGNMFGFIGKAGCGKSTATEFLSELVTGFGATPSIDTFTNVNNTHGTKVAENKQALIFEEFTTKSRDHSLQIFKQVTGKANRSNQKWMVNPKGETEREIDARLAITFNCEDIPKGMHDEGSERRAVYLAVTDANKSLEAARISSELDNFDSYQDVFNWLIQRDVESTLKTFHKLKTIDIIRENTIAVNNEQPIPRYLLECVVITDDVNDKLTSNELYSDFNRYILESGDYRMSRAKFTKELRKVLESKSSYGFQYKGQYLEKMRKNKTRTSGFTCVKFTTSTDIFEEEGE